jgi:hypothetical protein
MKDYEFLEPAKIELDPRLNGILDLSNLFVIQFAVGPVTGRQGQRDR